MVGMQNPLGFRTTFGIDSVDRHSVTADANGHSSTNVYDAASSGIASENALGHRHRSTSKISQSRAHHGEHTQTT
jgi:hypothetical protein